MTDCPICKNKIKSLLTCYFEYTCNICLEEESIHVTNCGHPYCITCIKNIIKSDDKVNELLNKNNVNLPRNKICKRLGCNKLLPKDNKLNKINYCSLTCRYAPGYCIKPGCNKIAESVVRIDTNANVEREFTQYCRFCVAKHNMCKNINCNKLIYSKNRISTCSSRCEINS